MEGPRGLERLRAQPGRAYAILYTALIAYENLLIGLDLMRKGETAVSDPYKVPQGLPDRRRLLGRRPRLPHPPREMDDGVLENYQILTPSTWMASPRDPFGNPGPTRRRC